MRSTGLRCSLPIWVSRLAFPDGAVFDGLSVVDTGHPAYNGSYFFEEEIDLTFCIVEVW